MSMIATAVAGEARGPGVAVLVQGKRVPVIHAAGVDPSSIDLEACVSTAMFQNWLQRIESGGAAEDPQNRLSVRQVEIQSADWFGKRIGFLKFKAECFAGDRPIPGIVFMRGGAVSVLLVLVDKDEPSRKFALVTKQARAPIALARYTEIPAGMLDGDGNFAGVCAKEIKEETGLEIRSDELLDMTLLAYGPDCQGMYPSPGGCDEFLRLFVVQKVLRREELQKLVGQVHGTEAEHEHIELDIVPLDDLWRISSDSKTLSSLLLYGKLTSAGLLDSLVLSSRRSGES